MSNPTLEDFYNWCISESSSPMDRKHIAWEQVERFREHYATAQPVSEPYKLNGWISVDEKMPEAYEAVLVHQQGGIIFCAEFEDGWFYPDEFPNVKKQGRNITHWMPLPAAPAQESE